MANHKTELELTWIGKENQPRLEPRILIEDPAKSNHAAFRVGDKETDPVIGRRILLMMALGLLAPLLAAQAQQPGKVHRVGVLGGVLGSITSSSSAPRMEVFRAGLRELGYVEGQNLVIEEISSEGQSGRPAALAAELVHRKVEVILTTGTSPTQAARNATSTIPIVMTFVSDPVGFGFIASLARPGGNITGLTNYAPELGGKWLELLKEASPKTSQVAVLLDPATPVHAVLFREMQVPATALGIKLVRLEVRDPNALEGTFATLKKGRPALVVLPPPSPSLRRQRILELAAKNRLPAMYHWREYVDAGGLAFYGASRTDMYRRAAIFVDKILKGAKPSDLPVEQPTKFELIINLKTAKALGLEIPQSLLLRADQVIR
jgi:putative ABC transport system substrate-binding protein